MSAIPLISNFFSNPDGATTLLFLLFMVPFLSIPGILCLWFGYELFKLRTEYSLCMIVGTITFLSILMTGARLGEWLQPWLPDLILESGGMLFLALIIVFSYPFLVSRLLPSIGGERKKPREFVGKGLLKLLAILLFFSLSSLGRALHSAPIGKEYSGMLLLDTLLQMLIAFSPFLIPYILYRIAVRYFIGKNRSKFDTSEIFPTKRSRKTPLA